MLRTPSFVVALGSTVLVVACATQLPPTAPSQTLSGIGDSAAISRDRTPLAGLADPRGVVAQSCLSTDTSGPSVTGLSATPSTLWSPNHKWNDILVSYTATDPCQPVTCRLVVTSDEPENGLGDGNTAGDIDVQDAHHVRLRAERSGTGNGRVYTINVECRDALGNLTTVSTSVTVAHDQRKS